MGAYGAALIAKERYVEGTESSIIKPEDMELFTVMNSHTRCKKCENQCILTINKFNSGEKFVTGNRCDRGTGKEKDTDELPNMYEYKYKRLFSYEPTAEMYAKRGVVGIPRVLNMYENYPFWFTFFTNLGFRVVISPPSTKALYEHGMETISSDTACYPAKMVHGHIKWLVDQGIKWIFYPSINYEVSEDETAPNHYNCPIVATYPEVIGSNMDEIFDEHDVTFTHPFLPYDNDLSLIKEMYNTLKVLGVSYAEVVKAVKKGRIENKRFKDDIKKHGANAIRYAKKNKKKCIILSGRPYHLDPEINHGIDKLITSFDMVVLTEDSVAHLAKMNRPIRVLDQWVYHSRLYKAALVASKDDDMELIQLNSFGCGLDAVTTDQVEEIMKNSNNMYTVLKIDEGSNLGAAKIRIRSLKAAIDEREKNNIRHIDCDNRFIRKVFTQEMRKDYTILVPQMSPIHFQFIAPAMEKCGYQVQLLPSVDKHAVDEGLRYINNDACYPTIVTLGQIISELKSGKYDLNRTAVFMSQTGGGCRASNYVALLRKALIDLKMEQVPVISFNLVGMEKNSGFKLTMSMIKRILMGAVYGDVLMRMLYATRPYEKVPGSADNLYEKWSRVACKNIKNGSFVYFKRLIKQMVHDFDNLPLEDIIKPKIGVVGEILVKYHPTANNDIVKIIENEGGEAVVLDLIDFFLYGMHSKEFNFKHLAGKYSTMVLNKMAIQFIEWFREPARHALNESTRFSGPHRIEDTANKAKQLISLGNQCGEGWLLTGEMLELLDSGVNNIVCLQPFGCLPNHVTGKGMMKALRRYNENANVVAVDYDPGASDVNQLNRIKLMMATAYKNMEKSDCNHEEKVV
ncbi:acyl-CoA dehydratase activase-related protein [Aminipila terrae]|uniref:acyl-CoA dehydratase activase-related protein n=1 Tax=Aminipila terrae TaxID=2697030 RepID=UPI002ED27F29